MPTPQQNRFQTFGIGQQAQAGTSVLPTVWLAVTDNSNVIADPIKKTSEYAYESRFPQAATIQGISWENKTVGGKASAAWLKLIFSHMFGAPVTNVITPSGNSVDAELFPVKPLTIEGKHPAGNLKVVDTVCQETTITLVERDFFTCSHVFSGLNPTVLVSPAAATVPAQSEQYQYSEFTAKVNTFAQSVQAFTATFKNGITTLDASGSMLKVGFTADGEIELTGSITFLVDNAALATANLTSEGTVDLEFIWTKGANKNFTVAGKAEVTTRSVNNGMGKTLVTYNFKFVSVAGAAPFTITYS